MMTQSKSNVRHSIKLVALLPFIIAITLLPGCESTTPELTEEEQVVDVVSIEITNDNNIIVNEKESSFKELEEVLESSDSQSVISMRVQRGAEMGVITDVQTLLRTHNRLRINYSRSDSSDELEKLTKEYIKAAEAYMKVDVSHSNYEELKKQYEEALKLYESIQYIELDVPPLMPPPPPMVPSPEKRMSEVEVPPAPPIRSKNLMQILMNSQGMLLMNEQPATLDEVKERIIAFVNNRGEDPDLSESPDKAVVSIKTDPRTPYDTYLKLVNEVTTAYSDLRNEVSQNKFGMPYSSLGEDSSEIKEIKKIYPMKISIREPDQN